MPLSIFAWAGYLTSSDMEALSSNPSDAGFPSPISRGRKEQERRSGFRIMTVARGWSAEADRLLDYLEHGIFDAIEKQYLRSLIFAIYLDDQDPNNIVEAYTFNFKYQSAPGSDTPVPIMSLGEDLLNLSLNGHKGLDDPVNEATRSGKLHTLGDVQKSIKSLIKMLITCTTNMSQLPKQRFVKFKLLYNSNTPASYEPPHFGPGDPDKDRWFFTTHDPKETPEKYSVGSLETTWHE